MLFQSMTDGPCSCACHDQEGVMHMMPCCSYSGVARATAEVDAATQRSALGEDRTREPPKYGLGQRVKVSGWAGSDFGIITSIKPVFHHRMGEWVWGYHVKYENDGPGLTFQYVPEGYVSSI